MKQRAFCWAALVFWVLGACTAFALRAERWMTPQVTAAEILSFGGLTIDALAQDETGRHVYLLAEGTGWEGGTRAYELSENDYKVMENDGGIHILSTYGDSCVLFSSKPLVSGEAVQVLARQAEGPDLWLAAAPPELLFWQEMPPEAEIVAERQGAALVEVPNARRPFLPDQGKKALGLPRGTGSLYSMGEFSVLCGELPWLGLLAGILAFGLLLWAHSFRAMGRLRRRRRLLLLLNSGVFLALLLAFWLVLQRVELPSSLLPREEILDAAFYARQFAEIFSLLESFAAAGSAQARQLLESARTGCALAIGCAGACVALACGLAGFQLARMRKAGPAKDRP